VKLKPPRRGIRHPIDQENEMNPYLDKFITTTTSYLQILTGVTEAANAKGKERTKRPSAPPSAILGGPFGCSQGIGAGIQLSQWQRLLEVSGHA
jgi:hypothetical protein